MIIRLLPNQVPMLWDAIKFATTNVDRINKEDLPIYLNRLLAALLNSKAQCFIRMDGNRQLLAVIITRFIQDELTGEKTLLINCLYSFQSVQEDEWKADMKVVDEFARKNGCKKIVSYSSNSRVFDIAGSLGFNERYRCFMKEA